MNTKSLILASLLMIIPILISNREKLGLEKDMIISVLRAVVQLVIVGYVLKYIFAADNKIVTLILVLIIIPEIGMIISQTMVAIGLTYRTLISSFEERREEIEAKLSLGADIKHASKDILRKSIKFAITPNIDSAKTLGIVSLPGMMTGLILGGASPVTAIKFQIMVTFMMMSASSMGIIIAGYLAYKKFYNERKQFSFNK